MSFLTAQWRQGFYVDTREPDGERNLGFLVEGRSGTCTVILRC
jgi:hypothetical protein